MEINFNNLRKQAAYTLDSITKTLNAGLLKKPDGTLETTVELIYDANGKEQWFRGNIIIDSEDIQKQMDYLRSLIMTICAVYEPDDDEFKDLTDHIEENGGVAHFNAEYLE